MHSTIFPRGTRGDVQPDLALGVGVHHAGDPVTLVAPHPLAARSELKGVAAQPVRFSLQEWKHQAAVHVVRTRRTSLRWVRRMREERAPSILAAIEEFWRVA